MLTVPWAGRVSLKFNPRESWDYPPHHLTRWSAQTVELALRKVGYDRVQTWLRPVDVTVLGTIPFAPFERPVKRLARFTYPALAKVLTALG